MGGIGNGGFNPTNNQLRNAGMNAQILEKEYRKNGNKSISSKERKIGYIGIGILSFFLIGILVLFFVL